MRIAIAVLIALVILAFGFGTLRGFARPRGGGGGQPAVDAVKLAPVGVRILYWCENCGTEVLLLRQGTEMPPRHCGEPMTRREETLREN
jgi:hypothetical protein